MYYFVLFVQQYINVTSFFNSPTPPSGAILFITKITAKTGNTNITDNMRVQTLQGFYGSLRLQ